MSIDPEAFQPLPLYSERVESARAEAEALLARANKMHGEATIKAERLVSNARTEADSIRDAAKAEAEARQKRDDSLDVWAARAIIAGTVGLTASGEYALARMVGFDRSVAWLLPFVIDVYVIQAFRRHRDIVQAIALTITANVIYHLADARLFGLTPKADPEWWLIAMVASIASLILWRVHLMTAPPKPAKKRRSWRQNDRQQTPPPSPTPPPAPAPAVDRNGDNSTAKSDRQESPTGDAGKPTEATAKKAPAVDKKPSPTGRQNAARTTAKKAASKRRSMGEWVDVASPVFHDEFARLRRNPTASEFAAAIAKSGLGKVSDSTAKNIRTEILDRAELPSLDGTE